MPRSTAKALERTGVRTALAYLRMGLDPGALRRDDVQQTIRRPSRGIAPNVAAMVTERADDLGHRHQAPGRSSLRTRRPQAAGLCRCPRRRGRGLPKLDRGGRTGRSACRSAWARRWTSWTRRDGRPIDRPTPTTSSPSRRWRRLHPEAATFEAWLRELLARPPRQRAGCAALDDPQDQGPGVGTRHRLRRVRGTAPPPPERGRGGRTARLPRRPDPSHPPGGGAGRCGRTLALRGGARWQPALASATHRPTGAGRKTDRRQGADSGPAARSAKRPARSMPRVTAEVGLALEYGGHSRHRGRALRVGGRAPGGCGTTARCPSGPRCGCEGATVVLTAPGDAEAAASSAEPYERRAPCLALRVWPSGSRGPGVRRAERQRAGRHRGHRARDAGRTGPLQGHRTQSPGALG